MPEQCVWCGRIIGATSVLDAAQADCFNTVDERDGCWTWAESASVAAADFAHAAAKLPAQQNAQRYTF